LDFGASVCTLILLRGVVGDFPLVLAMNRDEFLDRPSAGPRLWPGSPPFVAPVDLRAGGTWCGLSASGVLVAVTNRGREREGGKRSRGALVVDLLRNVGRSEALARLEGSEYAAQFNGFHAIVADAEGAAQATSDAEGLRVDPIPAPIAVVTNGGATPDIRQILGGLDMKVLTRWGEAEAALTAMLRRHDLPTCRHGEDRGTRSSLVFALRGPGPEGGKLLFADGPPCTTPYQDLSATLHELEGTPWTA